MKKEVITIDDIIEETVGSFSRWQIYTIIVIAVVKISLPWHQLGIVFLAPPPHFSCSLNDTEACSLDCPSHEFDRSVFTETIITEWDLVCDKGQLPNVSQLIYMFGILLGNVIFGYLSDRFGRRQPMIWAVTFQILSSIGIAFSPWLWMFMTLRLICGIATGGTMLTTLVLLMEIIGKDYRMMFGILFQLPSIAGHAMMGLIGHFLRNWHHFQIAISVPSILLLSCYWILPESPRWLLTVGQPEKAIEVLTKAAAMNRKPTFQIKDIVGKYMKQETVSQGKPGALKDLFSTKNIRKRTICIFVCWLITGLAFYAAAQYMGRMGGNIFLNISLGGIAEIPGNFIVLYLLHKLSRKRTLYLANILGTIACFSLIFVPNDLSGLIAGLGALSLLGISASFTILYVFTGELYPTVIRNIGLGMASMSARIGSMIAPFVASLNEVNNWLAPLIFGTGPILCILIIFFLPETANKKLPDTIEDIEMFRKDLSGKMNSDAEIGGEKFYGKDEKVSKEEIFNKDKVINKKQVLENGKIQENEKNLSDDKIVIRDKIVTDAKFKTEIEVDTEAATDDKIGTHDKVVIDDKILTHDKTVTGDKIITDDKTINKIKILNDDKIMTADKIVIKDKFVDNTEQLTYQKSESDEESRSNKKSFSDDNPNALSSTNDQINNAFNDVSDTKNIGINKIHTDEKTFQDDQNNETFKSGKILNNDKIDKNETDFTDDYKFNKILSSGKMVGNSTQETVESRVPETKSLTKTESDIEESLSTNSSVVNIKL